MLAGVAPAVAAALGFAVFQLINRRALAGVDVYRGTAALLATGAALLALIVVVTGDLALVVAAPWRSLAFCAAAGFVHFCCGWTFLGLSQVRLGAARAGILIGTVPLFGALIAALALGERLGPAGVLGLFVVSAGVVTVAARGGASLDLDPAQARMGVAAGLATALCWASSPTLIRLGLEGLPSPVAGAAIGMLASAVVYALAVALTRNRAQRAGVTNATRRLLVVAGCAVSLSVWLQWIAFDLAPVAMVLALLQLTPITVVLLANRLSGDRLGRRALQRVWIGAALTVAGSLVLVLAT